MKKHIDDNEYILSIDAFHSLCSLLLFEFANYHLAIKDQIICNFIARTDTMIRGIKSLWEIYDYQDCWILFRCLLDRLFTLVYINENNQFELFDDWSFYNQYIMRNRMIKDPKLEGKLESSHFNQTEKDKERFALLSKNPPKWRRPKAKKVAKQINLTLLYTYGYDYGSTHVHPMANDGNQDFYTITGLLPSPNFPKQQILLPNSILVSCLIVNNSLLFSNFKWHKTIIDFIDQLIDFLSTGSQLYKIGLQNISKLGPNQKFSKPKDKC